MYFEAEVPFNALRDLATAVKDGRYTDTETIDCACHVAGCLNALRGPQPLGAEETDAASELTDEECCDQLLTFVDEQESAPKATADGPNAIPPWLIPIALDLVQRIFSRWLSK